MMKDERNDDQKPVEHKLDQRTQGKEGKGMMKLFVELKIWEETKHNICFNFKVNYFQ